VATSNYMRNRVKWSRPQGLLFSDNPGTLQNNLYIPNGDEGKDFIILSDHNREPISLSQQRIENRVRMINGNMRSYHTADKVSVSTSWEMLPSRAFSEDPEISVAGVVRNENAVLNTADTGAGGSDLLRWYEDHPGPFYVYLSYDKTGNRTFNRYTQVLRMYFASFDHTVATRGKDNFDMWNISLSLEEV
jgi:hypothetical protein